MSFYILRIVVGIVMEYAKYETLFNTMVKYGWSTGMPTVLIQQVVRQVYRYLPILSFILAHWHIVMPTTLCIAILSLRMC